MLTFMAINPEIIKLMKIFSVLAIFLAFMLTTNHIQADETYSRVRISLDETTIEQIKQLGIDLGNSQYKPGHYIKVEISAYDRQLLQEAGIAYEVLIPDMTSWYQARYEAERGYEPVRDLSDRYPVPENWEFGSMGGFYTYDEIVDKLDFLAAEWPDLVSVKQPISDDNSHWGYPIWWVRMSNDPENLQDKPKVLYTSLIHAREGIGVQQMFYFMLHLLENYETNQEVKDLVDNLELYFIPAVNPDGYLYNEQIAPTGGGMWRKNRRDNGGSFGVDINRNFGYMWGIDNNGSSPNPSNDTYRGPYAFSEPATDNVRILCETYDFQIALNYHSYSNLLLYPWGYTEEPCPDDHIFHAHATLMTQDNNYVIGPGSTTIYATNGGSDDWMYGEQETKDAIFAYTPELGSFSDGFWPPLSRIVPLCQENMLQNFLAGFLSGKYGQIKDLSPNIVSDHGFYMDFELKRLGFGETETWTVSIEPLDDHIIGTGDPLEIGYLEILEATQDSIWIELDPDLLSGTSFSFALHMDNGTFVQSDTLHKFYGITSIVFEDPCDNMDNWHSNKWDVTNNHYVSPPGSITDSPQGNYGNNEYNTIVLTNPIDLTQTNFAQLTFMAKWDIEANYDYVQLLGRSANSVGWVPLEGKYTRPGSSNQSPGKPVYDGTSDWVQEEVDISFFAGSELTLSFVLVSDGFVTGDGFYFDDVVVEVMDIETSVESLMASGGKLMGKAYPNPASTGVTIPLKARTQARLDITDLQGRSLQQMVITPDMQSIKLDVSNWQKGIYFLKVDAPTGTQVEKIVIK